MDIAQIRLFPDPILRRKCKPVKSFDKELLKIIQRLDRTMRAQPHGIGIAAPQIGIDLRLAIVDVSARVPGAKREVLANPSIQARGTELRSREGCMSLPDYTADLQRYEWVEVKWQDEKGKRQEGRFEGIEAVCFQHEIDHLNGILFLDRVTCLKSDMYPRSFRRKR